MAGITRVARAALLSLSLSAASARGDEVQPPAPSAKLLSVGVAPAGMSWAGFDRDLFAAVALDLGLGLAWVEVPAEAALRGLDAGRFDIAAGPFAPGEAAGYRLLPAVAARGDALLKRRGDGAVLVPADIAGKVIAVVGGSAETARLRALAAALRARVRARPGFGGGDPVTDLAAGRLAAVAGPLDEVAAAALARPDAFEVVGLPFGPADRLAPVLRPEAAAAPLAAAAAAALGRMRADGRLAALQRRWFGLVLDPPEGATAPVPSQGYHGNKCFSFGDCALLETPVDRSTHFRGDPQVPAASTSKP